MTKLKWGLIGGGAKAARWAGARLGARVDGLFDFVAGTLDHRPGKAAATAKPGARRRSLLWRLAGHARRRKRPCGPHRSRHGRDPNATHFEITRAFLEAGIDVLCEKPMTMTVEEGEEIVRVARKAAGICAVNYGYTGYALVRHMRAMVARGDLGSIRMVVAEFAHGHHADVAAQADNPRVRWRYDPAQAGISAQFADCGIHALHMASFVLGQQVTKLSAIRSPASRAGFSRMMRRSI